MLKNCFEKLQEIAEQETEQFDHDFVVLRITRDGNGYLMSEPMGDIGRMIFVFDNLEQFTVLLAQYKLGTVKI